MHSVPGNHCRKSMFKTYLYLEGATMEYSIQHDVGRMVSLVSSGNVSSKVFTLQRESCESLGLRVREN